MSLMRQVDELGELIEAGSVTTGSERDSFVHAARGSLVHAGDVSFIHAEMLLSEGARVACVLAAVP